MIAKTIFKAAASSLFQNTRIRPFINISNRYLKMSSSPFEYDYALVCRSVPKSLVNGLSLADHEAVNLDEATAQHRQYLDLLRSFDGLKLIEVDADERFPDCVFVEDTLVVVDNRVFITNPGAESRRDEVDAIRRQIDLVKNELGLDVREVVDKAAAFVDGGDCCYTSRELIVGLSQRTNEAGVRELSAAFAPLPVIGCRVEAGLHLKSAMTMIAPDKILIGRSASAQSLRRQIEAKSAFAAAHYEFVEIGDDEHGSANVLVVNGSLIYPQEFESLYGQLDAFRTHPNTRALDNSEFRKIDGCLTCRSVLLRSAARCSRQSQKTPSS